jgi:dTMP kinase
MRRGALIVLEGIDRTGKTSQATRLVEALRQQGVEAQNRRFPDRTTATGAVINSYLQSQTEQEDHVIHLLFAANRWEARSEMERLLASGTTLVVDRYSFSGVAFSAAKGMDFEWCRAPEKGLLEPDVVVYLDISIEEAKKRGDYGKERYEREEFQRQVRGMYERLKGPFWITVDAARSMDDIHAEIKAIALRTIEKSADKPLKNLWV